MAETTKSVQEETARRETRAHNLAQNPDYRNEDGSVSDNTAKRYLKELIRNSNTSASERLAADHRMGTPAWMEENSPEHMHSDGGSTLAPEMGSVLDVFNEALDELRKERDERDKANERSTQAAESGNKKS